jgi:hypothetical protein
MTRNNVMLTANQYATLVFLNYNIRLDKAQNITALSSVLLAVENGVSSCVREVPGSEKKL